MTYCDSSFLVSLYTSSDVFYNKANAEAKYFSPFIPYTSLNELELVNTLHRSLANSIIPRPVYDAALLSISMDEATGFLTPIFPDPGDVHLQSLALSKQHTPQFLCRALDILHVAAAMVVNARQFASFDIRQRNLANAVGLTLVPAII